MSSTPQYYIADNDLLNDGVAISLAAILEEAMVQALQNPTKTLTKTVKILGQANAFSQLAVETFDIVMNGEDNSVSIGGAIVDMAANAAGATVLAKILALTPFFANPVTIALVSTGAFAVAYSAFAEPLVNDSLDTLAGKDMIQYFDENGDEISGLVFPDGYPGTKHDAIKAFIAHEKSANYDLTKGHIQVDDDLAIDENFIIKDASIFQTIADRLNVTLSEFLSFSSGGYNNDEFYVLNDNGQALIFYFDEINRLRQSDHSKLALPVSINGVQEIIVAHNIYVDGQLVWGGSDGDISDPIVRVNFAPDGGGVIDAYFNEASLLIGSDEGDVFNNKSFSIDVVDTIIGGGGADTIFASISNANDDMVVDGGEGDDVIFYAEGGNTIYGGADNDYIGFNEGTISLLEEGDLIDGGAGSDTIEGSGGADTIDGGEGSDWYYGTKVRPNSVIDMIVDLNNEIVKEDTLITELDLHTIKNVENIITGAGDDTIIGDVEDNIFISGAGDDSLVGGAGADTIIGSEDDDTIDGGADEDTVDYRELNHQLIINIQDTGNTEAGYIAQVNQEVTGLNDDDKLYNIEKIIGSNKDDSFVLHDMKNGLTIDGALGDDVLDVVYLNSGVTVDLEQGTISDGGTNEMGITNIENVSGSFNDDVLIGDRGNNELDGKSGADTLVGGEGSDTLIGGSDVDRFVVKQSKGSVTTIQDFDLATEKVDITDLNVISSRTEVDYIYDTFTYYFTTNEGEQAIVFQDHDNSSIYLSNFIRSSYPFSSNFTLNYSSSNIRSIEGLEVRNGTSNAFMTDTVDIAVGVVGTTDSPFYGLGGNDTISGYGTIDGGAGNDYIRVTSNEVSHIYGGDNHDILESSYFFHITLDGGSGNDILFTYNGTLKGGTGADIFALKRVLIDEDIIPHIEDFKPGEDTINVYSYTNSNASANVEIINQAVVGSNLVVTFRVEGGFTGNVTIGNIDDTNTIDASHFSTSYLETSNLGSLIDNSHINYSIGTDENDTQIILPNSSSTTLYSGGIGADEYVITPSANQISIIDFDYTDGDIIDLSAFSHIRNMSDLGSLQTVTDSSGNTGSGYHLGDGQYIMLTDSSIALIEDDFIFADGSFYASLDGENINGSANADTIYGSANADTLSGLGENDSLEGYGGDDILRGGEGQDTLRGGSFSDELDGGNGNDILDGGSGYDFLYGGEGSDTLNGASNNDELTGGIGADNFIFTEGEDIITDFNQAEGDTLDISTFRDNDIYIKQNGTDTEISFFGNGILFSESYNVNTPDPDTVTTDNVLTLQNINLNSLGIVTNLDSYIRAGDTDDDLTSGSGNDTIEGGIGNDTLHGGTNGSDSLDGGQGNDTLYAASETDTLTGGADNDTFVITSNISTTSAPVITDFTTGDKIDLSAFDGLIQNTYDVSIRYDNSNAIITIGDDYASILLHNIVSSSITNSDFIGNASAISIVSNGDDLIEGTSENDVLTAATEGSDTLVGGSGEDTFVIERISGITTTISDFSLSEMIDLSGLDQLINSFEDLVITQSGNDTYIELPQNQYLILKNTNATDITPRLFIGDAAISAQATNGNDLMQGDLYGFVTNDTITALAGNDTIDGLYGNDRIYGGEGTDIAIGNIGNDSLYGGIGNDSLYGGVGNDYLNAGIGNTHSYGEAGNDTLVGASSNTSDGNNSSYLGTTSGDSSEAEDTIPIYDEQFDTLSGGEDIDYFQILQRSNAKTTIEDFELTETIDLSAFKDLGVNEFSDLTITEIANGTTTDVLIDLGYEQELTIQNTLLSDINASNFHFENTITGTSADDLINVAYNDNYITGLEGNDILDGGIGSDSLYGNSGDDTIYGREGDDIIDAGDGNNFISGGEGYDSFYISKQNNASTIIEDYESGESIFIKLDSVLEEGADSLVMTQVDTDVVVSLHDNQEIILKNTVLNDISESNFFFRYTVPKVTISGTDNSDLIQGDSNSNYIYGYNGDDTIYAGDGGYDYIYGGEGNDLIYSNIGSSVLEGQAGNDTLVGGEGYGISYDGSIQNKFDTLEGGEGIDTFRIVQNPGAYIFVEDFELNEIIDLTDFDGTFNNFSDLIFAPSDVYMGGTEIQLGNEQIVRLPGVDVINLNASHFLFATVVNPISGTDNDDTITGTSNNDSATVGAGNDDVDLGASDDEVIIAGTNLDANDTLSGGEGIDTLSIIGSTIEGADFANITSFEEIIFENDHVHEVTLTDAFVASSDTGSVFVDFSAAVSPENGALLDASAVTSGTILALGGAGNDSLIGGMIADSLVGNAGDDTLDGGLGNDTLTGGAGSDVFMVNEEQGSNTTITDFESGDMINLEAFTSIYSLSDLSLTQNGNDTEVGLGNGQIITLLNMLVEDVSESQFVFANTPSVNIIHGTSGDDSIGGTIEDDIIYGYEGRDTLVATGGSDTLFGGADGDFLNGNGDAVLYGEDGNDQLRTHSGNNTLIGGGGDDHFYLTEIASGTTTTIADFEIGSDKILLNIFDDYYTSFSDLSVIQSGDDTVIDLIDGQKIILKNMIASQITADDIFGDAGANIAGTEGDDNLLGSSDSNIIYGLGGNDTIQGGVSGDNSIYGGEGNDRIFGGTSTSLNTSNDLLSGDAGNDYIASGNGSDTLLGGLGNDTLLGQDGDDTINGGSGNNILVGDSAYDYHIGADTFIIEAHDNTTTTITDFEVNVDTLDLSAFTQFNHYNDLAAAMTEVNGNVVITLSATQQLILENLFISDLSYSDIIGTAGREYIAGTDASESLNGDGNDEYIEGFDGNDSIKGYDGNDVINTGLGADTVRGGNDHDVIYGGDGADSITGDAGDDTIYGEDGDDYIRGSDGADYIDGGAGADTIEGGEGLDTIWGNDGDDLIIGSGKADYINGGKGNDSIRGGEDTDIIRGGDNNDTIEGNTDFDYLYGDKGNDVLYAFAGNDFLYGGEGNDSLLGGTGGDYIEAGADNDTVEGGDGNETIFGEAGDDVIDAGSNNDTVDGGADNDSILGGSGSDSIIGGDGNDTINGEDNGDRIYGGAGVDQLTGGVDTSSDDFYYTLATDSGIGIGNRDIITDFTTGNGDDLNFSEFAGASFSFINNGNGTSDFSGTQAEIVFEQIIASNHTLVYVDSTGDGTTNFEIELTGMIDLSSSSFVL